MKSFKYKIDVDSSIISEVKPVDDTYWQTWVNEITDGSFDEYWGCLTEEEKIAYQKKYCQIEQIFYKDETPNMVWTLNTDWSFNITDLENGVTYCNCKNKT